MAEIVEAQSVLSAFGMPAAQQNRMSALTLLALCGLTPAMPWTKSVRCRCTITKGIMEHMKQHYEAVYAPNTRETIRRQVLHQFVQARVADYNPFDPSLPTNSPRAHYAITEEALLVVRSFGSDRWDAELRYFLDSQIALLKRYDRDREHHMIPVQLPEGKQLDLSPGQHNRLQKAVIEEFSPRFAPDARLLYLGDTAEKNLLINDVGLRKIGIKITRHDKLPDIVLHQDKRHRLFLIEVVTSHGPMSPKRVVELDGFLADCTEKVVYVSVFQDFDEFRKYIKTISWGTEVWISERPDHLIHFNGDPFLDIESS